MISAIVLVILGIVGLEYNFQRSTTLYVYQSEFNSSDPCAILNAPNSEVSNATLSSLIANVESNPKFIALEGNRTGYSYDGSSCGPYTASRGSSGANASVSFVYYDYAHRFSICDSPTPTTPPQYVIAVNLDMTPTGYDLGHSIYTSVYYGPTNSTLSCTTTAAYTFNN